MGPSVPFWWTPGGPALPCQPEGQELGVAEFARRISGVVRRACSAYGIPTPRLAVEPGRAIVGAAGLTLYRVLTVKRGPRTQAQCQQRHPHPSGRV